VGGVNGLSDRAARRDYAPAAVAGVLLTSRKLNRWASRVAQRCQYQTRKEYGNDRSICNFSLPRQFR
jgi:hypothetical protein